MVLKHPLANVLIITVISLAVLLLLPLKVPFSISTHGRVFYEKGWVVVRESGGRISAALYDRIRGQTDTYKVHQFERQDAVRFELHSNVRPGNFLKVGDTLGYIHSTQLEREVVALVGELARARASLDIYLAGEKLPLVDEARRRVEYAQQQRAGHTLLLERTRELHRRNLISDAELEIAEHQAQLYEIDVLIADAQLTSVLTGAKEEQIAYLHAHISALEDEIHALKRTIESFTYISPISGVVYHTFSNDTLAIVGSPAAYVAVIPVPLRYRDYVAIGQNVTLRIPGNNTIVRTATIHSIGNTVRVMNGDQYFMVNVVFDSTSATFLPGILASARIHTGSVTLREYFGRYIRPILN